MKSVLSILLILMLAACSSTPEKKQEKSYAPQDLKDSDFKKTVAATFIKGSDYYFNGGAIALGQESLQLRDKGDLEKFESSKDPLSAAMALCYNKKVNEGLALFNNVYERYKNFPSFWTGRGICYVIQKQARKAMLYFNKALELDSRYTPALNNVAVLLLNKGEKHKALNALKLAEQSDGTAFTPRFNLAHLYLEYYLVDEAEKLFFDLYKVKKKDADVLSGLGTCFLLKNDIATAVKFFKAISESLMELRPDIALNYALALKMSGKREKAMEIIEKVDKKRLKNYSNYYAQIKKALK